MKKLLSVIVTVCFLSMTAAVVYGQDTPKKEDTKGKKKKKSSKKKEETPKKDGGK